MKKLIETKFNDIEKIKSYMPQALELTNKAINFLKENIKEPVTVELITKIVNTCYCESERENAFNDILKMMGMTKELLITGGYDMQRMYWQMATNKVKFLYDVKGLFKNICSSVIECLNYISIKDNKAELIENFDKVLTEHFTEYTENDVQDKILSSLQVIQKELLKLKEYNIGYYKLNNFFYENENKLNISSYTLKGY